MELQSLVEQACNFYLKNGCFPDTYEEMQAVPVQTGGILPYAGDDGGEKGQAYRLRIDLQGRDCFFAFRAPDQTRSWPASWTEPQMRLPLPDPVVARLEQGAMLAPTLREIAEPDARATPCSIASSRFPSPSFPIARKSNGCSDGIGGCAP